MADRLPAPGCQRLPGRRSVERGRRGARLTRSRDRRPARPGAGGQGAGGCARPDARRVRARGHGRDAEADGRPTRPSSNGTASTMASRSSSRCACRCARPAGWSSTRGPPDCPYGTYLASVIDGAPCPGSLAEAVRALTASTDQLAALSRDLNDFDAAPGRRRVRREPRSTDSRSSSLFDEVRKHLRLTSALAARSAARRSLRPTEANPS